MKDKTREEDEARKGKEKKRKNVILIDPRN